MRPPSPSTVFEHQFIAKDICIQAACADITLVEKYIEHFSLSEYSCMVVCGIYTAVMTLVSHLEDDTTHGVFSQACRMLRRMARDHRMASFVLQGVKALAWSLELPLPALAQPFLEDFGSGKEELRDIPLAFALPQAAAVRKIFSGVAEDDLEGIELGDLLSRWSTLSID